MKTRPKWTQTDATRRDVRTRTRSPDQEEAGVVALRHFSFQFMSSRVPLIRLRLRLSIHFPHDFMPLHQYSKDLIRRPAFTCQFFSLQWNENPKGNCRVVDSARKARRSSESSREQRKQTAFGADFSTLELSSFYSGLFRFADWDSV